MQCEIEGGGATDGLGLAAERAANGRGAPWKLRFWAVGNESWGCAVKGGYKLPVWKSRRRLLVMRRLFSDI